MNPFATALRYQHKAAPTTAQLLPAWRDNQPLFSDWDTGKAIKDGFKASTWVYACVTRRAQAAASLPWKVFARGSVRAEWEEELNHPLSTLLEYPNAFMSRQDIIERVIEHLDLGGNALWTITRSNMDAPPSRRNPPLELWPIDPTGLKPIPSRALFISGYEYLKDGVGPLTIPAADVIHFSYCDPANPYWGMSPLMALARTVDTDLAAVKWNLQSFSTRAIPETVFTIDRALTTEEWEQARDELKKSYGDGTGRQPWVVGNGASVQLLSWKPTDMDFIEGRRLTREDICGAYAVPPPLVGIMEHATLANVDTYRKIFWSDTMIPLMDNLEAAINRMLVPFFGARDTLKVCYDTAGVEVLRADMGAKTEQLVRMVQSGVPINAALEELEIDIDAIEGGDVGFVPATVVPITLAGDLAKEELRATSAGTDAVARQSAADASSQAGKALELVEEYARERKAQLPTEPVHIHMSDIIVPPIQIPEIEWPEIPTPVLRLPPPEKPRSKRVEFIVNDKGALTGATVTETEE